MSEYLISMTAETIEKNENSARIRITPNMQEVVRCRDCKFYEPDGIPSAVYPDRFWCDKLTFYMQPDGFCSWGERRD